ncbi:hypothetical protein NBT05_11195 [Aquimarina sp. ERC-38]|uniref:hypothetical protein n=1 Tax=Aquimarina sp. ERC-38 TaxID=2949996 RepID=UPI00224501C9|nr:hypothetical protein [Aquimarina sp. ERC-38]UZO79525.1 hypothetical protein NBT05_11195 [Aquimarina sp. ERC-38]
MKKKLFFTWIILTFSLVFSGYTQELQESNVLQLDQNAPYQTDKGDVVIEYTIQQPSLSYLKSIPLSTFTLMEIDLSVDLRRQAFQNRTPYLYESKNPHVIEQFSVRLPTQILNKTTITGRNRLDFTVNRGSVRNSVYKDASFYTGAYNPFTGLPY